MEIVVSVGFMLDVMVGENIWCSSMGRKVCFVVFIMFISKVFIRVLCMEFMLLMMMYISIRIRMFLFIFICIEVMGFSSVFVIVVSMVFSVNMFRNSSGMCMFISVVIWWLEVFVCISMLVCVCVMN